MDMKKNDKFCGSTSSDTNGSLRFRVHRGLFLVAAFCCVAISGIPSALATWEDDVLLALNSMDTSLYHLLMEYNLPGERMAQIEKAIERQEPILEDIKVSVGGIDGHFTTANALLTDIALHTSDTAFNTEELWNIGSISDDIKLTLNTYQPELFTIRTLLENMPQSMMDQLGPATLSDLEASLTAIETVLSQPPAVQVDVAISNDLSPDAIWEFEGQSSTEGNWDVQQLQNEDVDLQLDHSDVETEVEDVKTGLQNTMDTLELDVQNDIEDAGALENSVESSITSVSLFETLKTALSDLNNMANANVDLVFLPANTLSFIPTGLKLDTSQINAFTIAVRWLSKIFYMALAVTLMSKLIRRF